MTKYHFTVEGTMCFPLDMLRYDTCYPVDSKDVSEMDRSLNFNMLNEGTAQIKLASDHEPTDDRWHSFLWSVTECEKVEER